jgi:hypothetical protein
MVTGWVMLRWKMSAFPIAALIAIAGCGGGATPLPSGGSPFGSPEFETELTGSDGGVRSLIVYDTGHSLASVVPATAPSDIIGTSQWQPASDDPNSGQLSWVGAACGGRSKIDVSRRDDEMQVAIQIEDTSAADCFAVGVRFAVNLTFRSSVAGFDVIVTLSEISV